MFSVLKYCGICGKLKKVKAVVSRVAQMGRSQSFAKNGQLKSYATSIFKRKTILRESSIVVQLSYNVSNKGQTILRKLLLTFTGKKMFIGVLIGMIAGYYVLIVSICIVLREVIRKTVR